MWRSLERSRPAYLTRVSALFPVNNCLKVHYGDRGYCHESHIILSGINHFERGGSPTRNKFQQKFWSALENTRDYQRRSLLFLVRKKWSFCFIRKMPGWENRDLGRLRNNQSSVCNDTSPVRRRFTATMRLPDGHVYSGVAGSI